MTTPTSSLAGRLTRLGFVEPRRAAGLLADQALRGLPMLDSADRPGPLAEALGACDDPDLALLALVRLLEATRERDPAGLSDLTAVLEQPCVHRDQLLAVLGGSSALGDHLVAETGQWRAAAYAAPLAPEERIAALVGAVSQPGGHTPEDALRIAYREQLTGIAALDLTADDPTAVVMDVAAALAALAGAALQAAYVVAASRQPGADACRLAVIAMGKTGGEELNYISDVDVIFVAEPAGGADETLAITAATGIASELMRVCSASTAAGALWQVDPALRPEGKQGPLVRTVASHLAYYQRWAKTWEFQALLKARFVAGDPGVGQAYLDAVQPMVWQAASRDHFVEDAQAMRRRVEQHIPAAEVDRQLKLGPGGLRDVEFSVQLLQLVHGRTDESLRSRSTLPALAALSAGGYVGRDAAATLDQAYRYLRCLEHRIQLYRVRRTHLMPTSPDDLRRLGRSMNLFSEPAREVVDGRRAHAREVRRIHERLFYRPLLSAVARLSGQEARLSPEAAKERLAALGFRDPKGAMRHLEALTSGVSRTAAIQRTLLPVMLGWFADEADPDDGLLAFRRISDELGATHWYLRLLRDEGMAAERLAHTLARSRYAADLLIRAPETVQLLGDDDVLVPRSRADIERRMALAADRKRELDGKVDAIRAVRRTELFRIVAAELAGQLDVVQAGHALTDEADAMLSATLRVCCAAYEAARGEALVTDLLIVGMGSLGAREGGYGSDADVVFVHRPAPGADEKLAQVQATEVVKSLIAVLGKAGAEPALEIDIDLRPEGKNGPIVRSLDSYAAYYQRWSLVWESQALLRARPVAGDPDLAAAFVDLIAPGRYPKGGLSPAQVTEIRLMKARVESERLPRGADRATHLKLGSGGLSDVEWVVQLLQLQHAHSYPSLQTSSTMAGLDALVAEGLLDPVAGEHLRDAWRLAASIRNAGYLAKGRNVDAVPSDARDRERVARIIGMAPGHGGELPERYRRVGRLARKTFETEFFR